MAFCGYLKQSTTVTIQLGPFVDDADGKTPETGLTIEDTDVFLSKNGGAFANPNDTNNCSHDQSGYYTKQLNATDTGTLGLLTVESHESGALLVRQDYQVVIAHWYDTMCSTDKLQVDAVEISGDSTAADNLELACDNYSVTRGLTGTALPAAAADAAGGLPISDGGGLALDTQLANTHEVTAARLSELDAGTAGKMANQVDEIRTDTGEIGAAGAGLSDLGGMSTGMKAEVESEVDDALGGGTGTALTAIPWNSNWDAEVESEVDDALGGGTGTALTAVPWNANWDAEVQSECADALTAYDPPTKAEMDTAHALLATPAQVNTQMVDVINVDTFAEPGQGAPAATATLAAKLGYLYKAFRNQLTQSATELKVYADDGSTVDQKATVSDDGTTYTRGEIGSGP